MASLRRLSIHESSVYAARTGNCSIHKTQLTRYHYWSSQASKPYGRSIIYSKDECYKSRVEQRSPRYTRLCGSWSRRYGRDNLNKFSKDTTGSAAKHGSEKVDQAAKMSKNEVRNVDRILGTNKFLDLLRHDASAAYKYLQKELDKDSYSWLYDSKGMDALWKKTDWWTKRRGIYDRNSSAIKQASMGERESTPAFAAPEDDFVIDPITLRKVPRVFENSRSQMAETQPASAESMTHDIPVKKYEKPAAEYLRSFRAPQKSEKPSIVKLSGFANQPWLVKNGFTEAKTWSRSSTNIPAANAMQSPSVAKIEPSLDRMLKNNVKSKKLQPSLDRASRSAPVAKTSLEYPLEEDKTDDVDLLTAGDIRAASGHVKPKPTTTSIDKQVKSDALNSNWQSSGKHYAEDLLDAYNNVLQKRQERLVRDSSSDTAAKTTLMDADFKKVKQHYDDLRSEIKQTARILKQARKQVLHDRLAMETNALKEVFDNFDTRSRKQMTALNGIKEAAQDFCDSTATKENTTRLRGKLIKLKRDAELVSQIKNIYEQSYGKITADHKQAAMHESKTQTPPSTSNPASARVYAKVGKQQPVSLDQTNGDSARGLVVRDLLYQSIDGFALPEATQKRVKFALRGIPELDALISDSSAAISHDGGAVLLEAKAHNPNRAVPLKAVKEQPEQASTPAAQIHRVSSKQNNIEPSLAPTRRPDEPGYLYKILALDNASNEVAVATTTSSIKHKASVLRSAASLLVHLDQPTKYFTCMEQLDAEGFQLVSGSRTMLVYRRRLDRGAPVTDETRETRSPRKISHDMRPLREEPVFSGHLNPKERLLRSYQLAHRRARSAAAAAEQIPDDSSKSERKSSRKHFYRNLVGQTGTVFLAVIICYMIGNINASRDNEQSARLRREEAAMRQAQAQKNERWWF